MANAYTLSMTTIQTTGINIKVTDKNAVLLETEVKIKKLDGSTFEDFDAFTVTNIVGDEGVANDKTATIVPSSAFTTSDVLLIQIDDTTNKSDIVMVDFEQQYTDNQSEYALDLPLATGNYILKLDNVRNEDFSLATASPEFTLEPNSTKPTPAGSSIALSRPNLVHFTDETLEIKVTLNNVAQDAPDGEYQVSFSADLQ